jgi:hypothetical protein
VAPHSLGFSVTFALIGGRLLVLAYSLTGRFPGSTVVVLAMIAIALPSGIYCLATVGGWQRSLASGASPSGLAGWIIRSKLAPVLPIAFMFFLLGLLWNMDLTPLDRRARQRRPVALDKPGLRRQCQEGDRGNRRRSGQRSDEREGGLVLRLRERGAAAGVHAGGDRQA